MSKVLTGSVVLALGALAGAGAAQATETITYTYDEHGRLVVLATTGTVNNGETVTIVIDKADNRTSYTVSGA